MKRTRKGSAMGILLATNAINCSDRQTGGVLAEPVRKEGRLSDTQVGWLATAFTLLYGVAGVPLGRLADRWNRSRILASCRRSDVGFEPPGLSTLPISRPGAASL